MIETTRPDSIASVAYATMAAGLPARSKRRAAAVPRARAPLAPNAIYNRPVHDLLNSTMAGELGEIGSVHDLLAQSAFNRYANGDLYRPRQRHQRFPGRHGAGPVSGGVRGRLVVRALGRDFFVMLMEQCYEPSAGLDGPIPRFTAPLPLENGDYIIPVRSPEGKSSFSDRGVAQ
jgi:hypothetical protein